LLWLLPLASHFAFSWIGFTPTDDGWLQAVARRLLDGQVPHLDFISPRPVLSALLQVPLVWLGGDHLFWWTRLWGWLEIGGIAWFWSGSLTRNQASGWPRVIFFGVIFVLTAHVFPVMAWHTFDGMLLCSAAVALAQRGSVAAWRGAFVLAGLATLTRQNFVFFLPFLALGLPSWRRWPVVLWSGLAPALYLLAITALHAAPDFVQQISSTRGALYQVAVRTPLHMPVLYWGLGVGALLATCLALAARRGSASFARTFDLLLLVVTGGYGVSYLWQSDSHTGGFALFGVALALSVAAFLRTRLDATERLLLSSALGLGWTVSISAGYNSPTLMAGVLLVVVWRLLGRLAQREALATVHAQLAGAAVFAALFVALSHARTTYPYMDRPAAELRYDAGEVVKGASGLYTNEVTYAALHELQTITAKLEAEHRPYAILTDYSAFWVLHSRPNPLNCEWPQSVELGGNSQVMITRFAQGVRKLPPDTVLIVQRHITALFCSGTYLVKPELDFYFLQEAIASQAPLIREERYFRLYHLPKAAR
jgi:hypothetical protein